MEERILMLENKIERLEKIVEEHFQSDLEITNTITSFMSSMLDFRNKYEFEYDDIIKNIELHTDSIRLLHQLITNYNTIQNFKKI
jgi:hypothetical protein